jgi:hypothetical protein
MCVLSYRQVERGLEVKSGCEDKKTGEEEEEVPYKKGLVI